MATSADKFAKVANNFVTSLSGAILGAGDTSMSLQSTSGLPTDTPVVLCIDRVDINGNKIPSLREYVKGVVSGSTVTGLQRGLGGSTAQGHLVGAVVEGIWSQSIFNDLVDALLLTLNPDGTVKTGTTYTSPVFKGAITGWIDPLETWAYSSYDATNKTGVITVPSDATTKYTLGMRVMFTNNSSVQYGLITAITSTTLTIYFGTNYSLTNSAITSPFYSVQKAPFGFPLDPAKWTQSSLYTGADPAKASPVSGTWYGDAALTNGGSLNLSVPIGAWRLSYSAIMAFAANTTALNATSQFSTLSTTTSTEVDQGWTIQARLPTSSTASNRFFAARERTVVLTTATPYYLLCLTADPNIGSIGYRTSAQGFAEIKATSAYL